MFDFLDSGTWEIYDPDDDIRVSSSRITAGGDDGSKKFRTHMARVTSLTHSLGATEGFGLEFWAYFPPITTDVMYESIMVAWSEGTGGYNSDQNLIAVDLWCRDTPSYPPRIYLIKKVGGVVTLDAFDADFGARYKCIFRRTGTALTLFIYDETGESLLSQLTLTAPQQAYSYFHAAYSRFDGVASRYTKDCYVENMGFLEEGASSAYYQRLNRQRRTT